MFGTNNGTAIPILNELDILGINGITTSGISGPGNIVTINGGGLVATLTGNTGGAVSSLSQNINTLGTGSITVVGVPGTHTLTTQLTGLTNHSVQVGTGAATLTQLAVGTNGQVLIGATGADPAFSTLTSTGGTILFTTGANTLNLETSGSFSSSFITNAGTAVPIAGILNDIGSGSIVTSAPGASNTVTTQLTGLTNHAVLVGAGSPTITKVGPTATAGQVLQSAGAAADPAFSTATYPLTTTVSQILYSSAANTVTGLATANRAVLTTGTTGIPVLTTLEVDGQLIIGSTAGVPAAATITAGTGISVTNASNSITIAVIGSGFTWTDVTTATQAMLVENGYLTDRGAGVVYTLPASSAIGDEIIVVGKLGITTITPNANQQILMSSASGTVGVTGTIVGTNVGDCVTLVCTTSGASSVYRAVSSVGNWTIN